jgi:hypothetical protein
MRAYLRLKPFVWSAIFAITLLPAISFADSGVIEFSDEAPPPSAREVALGKAWSARVSVLADQITRVSAVLQASAMLRDAVANAGDATAEQGDNIRPLIAAWQKAGSDLFTSTGAPTPPDKPDTFFGPTALPQPVWSINMDGIGAYVGATIALTSQLQTIPQTSGTQFSLDELPQKTVAVLNDQAVWFDELIAEHGILNAAIRWYPHLQTQTPISCDVVNKYSKLFVCGEAAATGSMGDLSWVFGPAQLSEYCIARSVQSFSANDSVHLVVRAKRTLADMPASPQLAEARIVNPLSSGNVGLKCE